MDLSHELSRDAHILTRNFSSAKSMRGARNTHQDDSTCCDAVSFPVVQRRTWRNWKVCACRRWCEGFAPQTASARVPISRSVPLHHRRRCAVEFIMMTQWYLINYASMKPYSCMQNWSNHASPSKGSINVGAHEIMRHLHPLFGGVGMPHFLFDPLWPQRPPKGASEAIMGWKNNEACRFLSGPPNNGGYLLSFASFWDRQNCEVIKT